MMLAGWSTPSSSKRSIHERRRANDERVSQEIAGRTLGIGFGRNTSVSFCSVVYPSLIKRWMGRDYHEQRNERHVCVPSAAPVSINATLSLVQRGRGWNRQTLLSLRASSINLGEITYPRCARRTLRWRFFNSLKFFKWPVCSIRVARRSSSLASSFRTYLL